MTQQMSQKTHNEWLESCSEQLNHQSCDEQSWIDTLKTLVVHAESYSHEWSDEEKEKLIDCFHKALRVSPTWGHLWKYYTKAVEIFSGLQKAQDVYKKGLSITASLELCIAYVQSVYKEGHLLPLVDALIFTLSRVGADIRSGPLWRELIALRIKIYNMRLTLDNEAQSNKVYLLDPFLAHEKSSNSSHHRIFSDEKLALLVSAAQDLVTTLPSIDPEIVAQDIHLQQLSHRLPSEQGFEKVRETYRQWLSTPTRSLKILWDEYRQFETTLAQNVNRTTASRVSSQKMVSTARETYTTSRKVYQHLKHLVEPLFPPTSINVEEITEFPPLRHRSLKDQKGQILVQKWFQVLSYETTNPLNLPHPFFCQRIRTVFDLCLTVCIFEPIVWVSYAQLLLSLNLKDQALVSLQRCVDEFLPNDEFLLLIFSEICRLSNRLDMSFTSLLKSFFDQAKKSEMSLAEVYKFMARGLPWRLKTLWWPALEPYSCYSSTDTKSESVDSSKEEREKDVLEKEHSPALNSVVVLHLFNLIRSVAEPMETHHFFMQIHSIAPKELYCFYAQVLWRVYGDMAEAKEVLTLGLERFLNDEQYCIHFAQQLLEMSLLDECRAFLLTAVSRIFDSNKVVPYKLWTKLFDVDEYFGTNSVETLKERQKVLGQQLTSVSVNERLLLNADTILCEAYGTDSDNLTPDMQESQCTKTPLVSRSLECGVPTNQNPYAVLKRYGMLSKMFRCGAHYYDLYKSLSIDTSLYPNVLSFFFHANPSTQKLSWSFWDFVYPIQSLSSDGKVVDQPFELFMDSISSAKKDSSSAMVETVCQESFPLQSSPAPSSVSLAPLDPGPTFPSSSSASMITPDPSNMIQLRYALQTLGTPYKKKIENEAKNHESCCDTSLPKPLQLFLHLLPKIPPSLSDSHHRTLVEFILSTLPSTAIPPIDIKCYTPLPLPSYTTYFTQEHDATDIQLLSVSDQLTPKSSQFSNVRLLNSHVPPKSVKKQPLVPPDHDTKRTRLN